MPKLPKQPDRLILLVGIGLVATVLASLAPSFAQAQVSRFRPGQDRSGEDSDRGPRNARDTSDDNGKGPGGDDPTPGKSLAGWVEHLETTAPRDAVAMSKFDLVKFRRGTSAVEQWSSIAVDFAEVDSFAFIVATCGKAIDAKSRIDAMLDRALELRGTFSSLPAGPERNAAINGYLQYCSALIETSGRLRYLLVDAVDYAAGEGISSPRRLSDLIAMLRDKRSTIGAEVMTADLFDPPADAPRTTPRPALQTKLQVLELIAATQNSELLPQLARLAKQPRIEPQLLLATAETICAVGLPQAPRLVKDATLPTPAVTPGELHALLSAVPRERWNDQQLQRVKPLLAWLKVRASIGLEQDVYQLGSLTVRPGDWLLMRNPSPYNLFTDLSPGLFTHVGVVTAETGSDGIRRMVLVDLPERGTSIPATNIDLFVQRTRHYVLLRHPDPQAAAQMAEAAASVIGNPSQFDLNFRTDRVGQLRGKSLHGQLIHTYCAGLLLLCAQETARPREEFFPLSEGPAGGLTRENLSRFGLTVGSNFVSPTGALFSPALQIVGRSEPTYEPGREIEEAIYDHFARQLISRRLNPTDDWYQTLRTRLAKASRTNPLLARAMAAGANVGEHTDLLSAAKAAAVIEALDAVATSSSADFRDARDAIVSVAVEQAQRREETASAAGQFGPGAGGFGGPGGGLRGLARTRMAQAQAQQRLSARGPQVSQRTDALRQRHAELVRQLQAEELSPRRLRLALVRFYTDHGIGELDARLFGGDNGVKTVKQ